MTIQDENLAPYEIKKDHDNTILYQRNVVQDSEHLKNKDRVGKEYLVPLGYFPNVYMAVSRVRELKQADNEDTKNLDEFLEYYKEITHELNRVKV